MNNPVVVITGATGVTGQVAARAFAMQGASLALLSSNSAKLEALAAELNLPAARLVTRVADLRIKEEVSAAATYVNTKFGRVDILLHLVGGWAGGKTLIETPTTELETMLAQHFWTTFHLIQAFTPSMTQHGWGRVVVVSSPVASSPTAKMGAYAVAKAAEETMLMVLAQESKGTGVTANVIQVQSIDVAGKGKGTTPDEIVAAMLYLCSDVAAKVNGARIPLY
jgi:NAD(P)-dependent dehydrogenase (short-subunit alcohol dehydrogenase family)